ncbi:isochorismatase family cysteine hydrolase [Peribacillus loiseleuriae]|uniref:Isochorismatase n=1 Tax=Peribacillus loiseleuriae TaxID=1679170 RepID=A0A0K9GTW4_9BACI|nr:isochorismatase family cysteine hydrolase [Peribacillus loiseleuriae]KMY50119.1 isochorismatase [Peribacillus loiseleuriae]
MQNQNNKTVLLVMHVQNGIVSHFGDTKILQPFHKAVEAARQNNIPVIHVRVAFSEGYPEVNPHNKLISAVKNRVGVTTVSDPETQVHESVQPKPNESVVTNYRISSFAGSNLEVILRSQQIDTLVLTGISTSGVVLSTLKVLSDACLEHDPEVQRVLIEKVLPIKADVQTVDAWLGTLN